MMFPAIRTLPLLAVAAALSACAGSGGPDYPVTCVARTGAQGAYDYPAGVAVPTVTPAEGGTQAGADAINACIREMAGVNTGPGVGVPERRDPAPDRRVVSRPVLASRRGRSPAPGRPGL